MMRYALICLIGILCSAGSFAQTRDETCDLARQLMREGHYLQCAQLLSGHLEEATDDKHRLDILFLSNECYYLLDDYRSLYTCATKYVDVLDNSTQLGDSTGYYLAYYNKIAGSYYYGQCSEEKDDLFRSSRINYERAMQFFRGKNDIFRQNDLHSELGQLYYKVKDYAQAASHLQVIEQFYADFDEDNERRPENLSALAMCHARVASVAADVDSAAWYFDLSLREIDEAIEGFNDIQPKPASSLAETYRRKGKILQMKADRLSVRNTAEAASCYGKYMEYQYRTLTPELVKMDSSMREQRWLSMHRFLYDCCRLGDAAPEMLYDLALFTKGYLIELAHNAKAERTEWKQVRQSLGAEDCALEFVEYYGAGDNKRLGCLVLRKDDRKPRFIDLADVNSLLDYSLSTWFTVREALGSTYPYVINALYKDSVFASRIWTPQLMQAVGTAKHIYFAPDGILHQLAVEYMIPDTAKLCHRLTSTRMVCERKKRPGLGNALFVGGIDFFTNIRPRQRGNDTIAYEILASLGTDIRALPGSETEVRDIYTLRHNPKDALLQGKKATDEEFAKRMDAGYSIVHLSTHGIFSGQLIWGTDLKPLVHDYSMSENVLLFAGASYALANPFFDPHLQDGVLSAVELSKLNFRKTDLVVLSACQTGMGRLTPDGIYGLQRALKQSGARALIVSLWEVSDKATNMMMQHLYEALESDRNISLQEAFDRARRRLMAESVTTREFIGSLLRSGASRESLNTPYYTNPFILIDAW